jgi:CRP-like cAMP-binding protein
MPNSPAQILIRRLQSESHLTVAECAVLAALPLQTRKLAKGQDIVREGDRPSQCCVILDGWACRYKVLDTGERQIVSFQVTGDIPDLQSLHLDIADHNIGTLTNSDVAFIPHAAMRAMIIGYPGIAISLWRDGLVDASITREWVLNVGAREAYGRLAHLLCETFLRLKVVGKTDGQKFQLPISQTTLGEATGMSTVHVNRSLQSMRQDGLIYLHKTECELLDWRGLTAAGQFDEKYLHIYNGGLALPN